MRWSGTRRCSCTSRALSPSTSPTLPTQVRPGTARVFCTGPVCYPGVAYDAMPCCTEGSHAGTRVGQAVRRCYRHLLLQRLRRLRPAGFDSSPVDG
eukprot:358397-Rhodomonas_salina.1